MTPVHLTWGLACEHGPTCTQGCARRPYPIVYVLTGEPTSNDLLKELPPPLPPLPRVELPLLLRPSKRTAPRPTAREQRALWRERSASRR